MESVSVFVGGKINLSLNILGKKGDMHLIDSVMASIGIGDTVTAVKRMDNNVNITFKDCTDCFGMTNKSNCYGLNNGNGDSVLRELADKSTVHKTVDYLKRGYFDFGVDIEVEKRLPIASGLGGSSADIAATLKALNSLFDFKGLDILKAGADLGSDVPFLLSGGTCRVEGFGERLTKLKNNLCLSVVLVSGGVGCSSRDVFIAFDRLNESFKLISTDNNLLISELEKGDNSTVFLFDNALTDAAESLCKNIVSLKNFLKSAGAKNAVMTGSGSFVTGFFEDKAKAENVVTVLRLKGYMAALTLMKISL